MIGNGEILYILDMVDDIYKCKTMNKPAKQNAQENYGPLVHHFKWN